MNTYAVVKSAGNASVALNAATYTPLTAQAASRVHVTNTTASSVALQVKQDDSADAITVPAATSMTFNGINNASQISVLAASGTPTLSYRWEH
jgi:hypothetical protein